MLQSLEIGIDALDPEALSRFWSAALGYGIGDFDADGTYLDLVPPSASLPVVYLQRVPEEKRAKNRIHLDLYSTDPEAMINSLVEAGAKPSGSPMTGANGGWWQVLCDPEGNEFCVCRAEPASPGSSMPLLDVPS